jgi:cell division protease FtsH
MVQSLPEKDQVSQTYEEMIAMLAMAMGGRVAEELIFGHDKVSSGAAGDIQQATRIARAMVTQLGFSDKLGTVAYSEPQQEQFLGYSMGREQHVSQDTQKIIDAEVRRFINEGYETAKRILTEKRDQLDKLAQGLILYETLSGQEIIDLLDGKEPIRES